MTALLERCTLGLTDDGWAQLERMGVHRTKRLPAYELERWFQVVEFLARQVYPMLEVGEAEYRMGLAFIDGYEATFIGKALFAVLRLFRAQRVVGRLARSFRTGNNFTELIVRDEQATSCVIELNLIEPRGRLTHGVLQRGLEVAGVRGVEVLIERVDERSADYRVAWAEGS